ncbi:uncharacterized protein VICG_01025 [Vittaforma corneae ATCC 50505]|uniref:Uncharacterized protein n=1 Tax=Vittaforma corneae (strain ATCC 50505) TaxID=993615 RepID=L2GM84_VITCO|nr:uncharacterized protein VICG_01025 [Vittaforma corneae ATCC 50505]ELA42008.1 hypothetical protein VICG_01025 [Vittaforma corneae ATCC 50505]
MIIKSMAFILLSLICAQVLLIDDLNLGKTPDGSRSLANLSGNLQNQYGESVSVVEPTQRLKGMPMNFVKYNKVNPQRINLVQRITPQMKAPNMVFPRRTMKIRRKLPVIQPNNLPLAQSFPSIPQSGRFNPLPKPTPPSKQVSRPDTVRNYDMETPNSQPSILSPIYFPNISTSSRNTNLPDDVPSDILNDLPRSKSITRSRKSNSPISSRTTPDKGSKQHSSTSRPTRTASIDSIQLDIPTTELSTPEIDKDIDESIFDNEPIRSVIKEPVEPMTKTPTRSISTKTVTRTVKEPIKVIEPVSVTVPEKKASVDNETSPDEVEKIAMEVSKIVVPHVKGTGYLKKHNSDIISADKHRRTYIDYKLLESKERQVDIEKKLKVLQELQNKLLDKLTKLKNERDGVKSSIDSNQITLENSERAIKNLQDEINKNSGQMKLEEVEIIKLEKALSEEKNRYLLLSDQHKIFQSRLDSFSKKGDVQQDGINLSKRKLSEYDKLIEQIEKDFSNLKERVEEVERKRNDEIEAQNRLEIEKKEIEDSSHLPLFALYD